MPALLTGRVAAISPTSFPILFGVLVQNPGIIYGLFPGAEVADGPLVYGLLVRREDVALSVKDLGGRIILAINPFTQLNIRTILEKAGMEKARWPEVRVASRDAALKALSEGGADAIIMDQPALAIALQSDRFRLLESNPRARYIGSPYWSGSGAVMQTTWKERSAELGRVVAAIDKAILWTREHELEAHRILAAELGIDASVADQMGGYYFPLSSDKVPLDQIDSTISALVQTGLLPSSPRTSDFFPRGLYGRQ
jgi:ABC-type nitrate/sulfonate/bicarbonate transport system substrate-binding protein